MRKAIFMCAVCFAFSCLYAEPAIQVTNLQNEETVGYQLLLIKGTLPSASAHIMVSSQDQVLAWPTSRGQFKALTMLKKGVNRIVLTSDTGESEIFTIYYNPIVNERFVRMVWVVPGDYQTEDYGKFQAPPGEDNSIESARKRMAFAGLIMQTANAELMYNAGRGRKTFRLARDADGEVSTTLHISDKNRQELLNMFPGYFFLEHMRRTELAYLPDYDNSTFAISSSISRYTPSTGIIAGEAWGGGNGGWIHSGDMFTWAEDISQVAERFSDTRDPRDFDLYDDSVRRHTFWGAYATTCGAFFHELGHTFGLGHVTTTGGIMSRGFDRLNRLFMVEEPEGPYTSEDIDWSSTSLSVLDNNSIFSTPETWVPVRIRINNMRPAEQPGTLIRVLKDQGYSNILGQKGKATFLNYSQ